MKKLVIGSRGSKLALWQAEFIKKELVRTDDVKIEIKVIKTTGDRIDNVSFSKMEGKGFFTKEIEEELLAGTIDIAVHSMKDLQTVMPDGLDIGAVCFRADPRELILIRPESYDEDQPLRVKHDAVIGTSSVRRQCQIVDKMPGVFLKDLRGNVPTRVNKLRDGLYDAIIIASAGVDRIEVDTSGLRRQLLDLETFVPAPAQGILAIQLREDDAATREVVSPLDEPALRNQISIERGLLTRLEGGCQLPLGAVTIADGGRYRLHAVLGIEIDGRWDHLNRADLEGENPDQLVEEAFRLLTEQK